MKKTNPLRMFVFITWMGFVGTGLFTAAAPGSPGKQRVKPVNIHSAPRIDGDLDDEAWQFAPLVEDFISHAPLYGEILPYKTMVWVVNDKKNLYFAFKCFDPEPQKIKTSITRRDHMYLDDWVGLSLDAQGNKHTSYHLYVNPNGIQGDALNSAVDGEDRAPDFVWTSAGKVVEDGYQVEIRLPLTSITFKSGRQVNMGILFWRYISRLGLRASWPGIETGQSVFNSHRGIVYKNLRRPLKFELLPAITSGSSREREGPARWGPKDGVTEIGLGVKYGLSSSVTAEIAINPDFSQVESDAFQVEVNQRYPLFYSEKRPFFMEGSDIFNFFTIFGGFLPHPVHTRRIGNPQWGIKITGSAGKASFGVLAAADKTPEQNSIFSIARGKYNLGKDNYIGFLYSGHELSGGYNRAAGADMSCRLFKHHKINGSFLLSYSTHGASHKNSDLNVTYAYQTRPLQVIGSFEHIGGNFQMDSSFLRRTGVNNGWIWCGYFWYPQSKKFSWLKVINPQIEFDYSHDLTTDMDDYFLVVTMGFSFTRRGYLEFRYYNGQESWRGQAFSRQRLRMSWGMQINRWLYLEGDLFRGDYLDYQAQPPYKGRGYNGWVSLRIQPLEKLNQQFNFLHSDLTRENRKIYNVNIFYSRTTYQFNKYFFLRAILQYDSYQKRLLTDFLASFTLIPGTVLHLGYGGLYEKRSWGDGQWIYGRGDLLNIKRGIFFKVSYLWRF